MAPRPVALPGCPKIQLDPADSAGRTALEQCIAQRFARQYGARIDHFLPFLLSLRTSGQLGAVAGLRLARQSELFLEQYLAQPVEQAISRVFRTPVDRSQVVEVGNLVSIAPGTASMLFGILAVLLNEAGIRWVVCTATPQVKALLDKLQFPTQIICAADPQLLGNQGQDWGSYYASRPQVIVGDAQLAAANAAGNQSLNKLMANLEMPVRRIAATLRAAG